MKKVSARIWLPGLAALSAISGIGAWACAGGEESPTWALVTKDYSSYGDSAVLTPGNDTRTNLLLLLADHRPSDQLTIRPPKPGQPNSLFSWGELSAQAVPDRAADEDNAPDWVEPSRCRSSPAGAVEFIAAVRANRTIPTNEADVLTLARHEFVPTCDSRPSAIPREPPVQSPAGVAFKGYLAAAGQFYAGDFSAAQQGFDGLRSAPDAWLREAALYMAARNQLNSVQQGSFDEYGSLVDPEKRDRAAIQAAGAAFKAYLSAYPRGRYAISARGLLRRVAWLAGDWDEMSKAYAPLLDSNLKAQGVRNDVDLANEIDLKMFADLDGHRVSSPILVAVADLMRMRQHDYECTGRGSWCSTRITKAEIESQRAAFGSDTELYDYIRAAEAFFVRHQPREVLQIIPDAARQPNLSYLQFSRQMLRGFALEATGDRNTRGFLLDLFGGATRPFQRDALELQLAMHDERTGQLGLVFAPDSKVRNPFIREILLNHTAGPALLRQQAQDPAATKRERAASLYILLSKELRHGAYADFLRDVSLVPPGAPEDASFYGAEQGIDDPSDDPVPLGIFVSPTGPGVYDCAPLSVTAATLSRIPRDVRGRLCLAEFMRVRGYDWFAYDEPLDNGGLASTKPLFPGPPYSRLEIYKAIMNDRSATTDEKAFALYRAVRCYAPSGNNSCGGTEVAVSVRRAWFNRLHSQYPQSKWTRELEYYW